jgi:two-component system, NtrC family, response regulator AtoC
MNGTILIVDDEESIRLNLKRYFERRSQEVFTAGTGWAAIGICAKSMVDVVLLDLRLPDMDGLEVLTRIKSASPQTAVIMITAHGDVDTAVKAMQMKADTFLLKPVDLKALESLVEKALETSQTRSEVLYLRDKVSRLSGLPGAAKVRFPPKIEEAIQVLASSPTTSVLIQGETGTGKGVAARLIHERSVRSGRQFMDINCATLTPEFLESELFGHEKGAFTDAKQFKRGLLEVAQGGTLFLDEIGEMPLPVQAKLLKAIEEKSFRRLGGTSAIQVDTRILAATNTDLERSVRAGSFRKDLFYRLNVMPLLLPPLRERRDEILPLAGDFLGEFRRASGRGPRDLTSDAGDLLERYPWPGNIRELKNVMERAALLCHEERVEPANLPTNMISKGKTPGPAPAGDFSLEAVERDHIGRVLEMCEGNRSQASKLLGIHRSTLIEKIQKYQLGE